MCTHPISLKVNDIYGIRTIQVPCGKCMECKKTYQNDWMCRFVWEAKRHKYLTFLTLTYNENSVPVKITENTESTGECYRTVNKDDLQRAIKRFRINQERKGKKLNFRYFVTSEYGPKTSRPHYHALFFGLNSMQLRDFIDDWVSRYGYVNVQDIPYSSKDGIINISRYVAKYCSKGSFECKLVSTGDVDKTFHLASKGLGSNYIVDNKSYHLGRHLPQFRSTRKFISYEKFIYSDEYLQFVSDHRNVTIDGSGFHYHMPKYWRDRIYGTEIKIMENGKPKTKRDGFPVTEFRTKNSLSKQVENFLFKVSCELRDQRAIELQSKYPDWSFEQALGFTYYEDSIIREAREFEALKLYGKFLNLSDF